MAFFEDENKTTVYAIIAIVAIVVVASASVKVGKLSLFPEENSRGLAVERFYGVRNVELEEQKVYEAKLAVGENIIKYEAYPEKKLLILFLNGSRYELPLEESDGFYYASHPLGVSEVRVVISTDMLSLWLQGVLKYNATKLLRTPLKDYKIYDGELIVRNKKITFEYRDQKLYVYDGDLRVIELVPENGLLVGVYDGLRNSSVILNPQSMVLTLTNVY